MNSLEDIMSLFEVTPDKNAALVLQARLGALKQKNEQLNKNKVLIELMLLSKEMLMYKYNMIAKHMKERLQYRCDLYAKLLKIHAQSSVTKKLIAQIPYEKIQMAEEQTFLHLNEHYENYVDTLKEIATQMEQRANVKNLYSMQEKQQKMLKVRENFEKSLDFRTQRLRQMINDVEQRENFNILCILKSAKNVAEAREELKVMKQRDKLQADFCFKKPLPPPPPRTGAARTTLEFSKTKKIYVCAKPKPVPSTTATVAVAALSATKTSTNSTPATPTVQADLEESKPTTSAAAATSSSPKNAELEAVAAQIKPTPSAAHREDFKAPMAAAEEAIPTAPAMTTAPQKPKIDVAELPTSSSAASSANSAPKVDSKKHNLTNETINSSSSSSTSTNSSVTTNSTVKPLVSILRKPDQSRSKKKIQKTVKFSSPKPSSSSEASSSPIKLNKMTTATPKQQMEEEQQFFEENFFELNSAAEVIAVGSVTSTTSTKDATTTNLIIDEAVFKLSKTPRKQEKIKTDFVSQLRYFDSDSSTDSSTSYKSAKLSKSTSSLGSIKPQATVAPLFATSPPSDGDISVLSFEQCRRLSIDSFFDEDPPEPSDVDYF